MLKGPAKATSVVQKGHLRQDLLLPRPSETRGYCCVLCYGESEQELWPNKDFNNNGQEAALLLKPFIKQISITWAPLSGWPGIIPLSRLGTNATDRICLQDRESFLLAIATADSYQLSGDVSKPTAFCTTRSQKYFAKAVKYSCLHYRLTRLCPSFSKFIPQT